MSLEQFATLARTIDARDAQGYLTHMSANYPAFIPHSSPHARDVDQIVGAVKELVLLNDTGIESIDLYGFSRDEAEQVLTLARSCQGFDTVVM